MNPIVNAAQSAYERTVFYRRLYGAAPQSEEEIPFISATEYFRAAGTLDCIDRSVEICSVLPPFRRGCSRLPHTVPESDADVDRRQERIQLALQDVGAEETRMLVVTTEANGPFACDFSTGVGWEGCPASIYYWNGSRDDLLFELEAHQPNWLVWSHSTPLPDGLNFPQERTILAHCMDDPLPAWAGAVWLFCDEVNLIGSRPAGRAEFRVDAEQFCVEIGRAGRPCLTTLAHDVFPLIRYELPHAFEVLG